MLFQPRDVGIGGIMAYDHTGAVTLADVAR
jgi:hypothetical protein